MWITALAALAFAIALLFLIPTRDVTQPPGRLQIVWELLAPGTSPRWGALGGVILVAWCFLVLELLVYLKVGSPYILMSIAIPNLAFAYGIPLSDPAHDVLALVNPSRLWIYLAPAVLFAVNLILVLRARKHA